MRTLTALLGAGIVAAASLHASPAPIWIEGETASTSEGAQLVRNPTAKPALLSGGALGFVQVQRDAVERLTDDGVTLTYDLQVAEGGRYELWNRVGFENVGSPFAWRVGDGPWTRAEINRHGSPHEVLTIDVVELDFWNPIAWARLGTVDLQPGAARLQIRLPRTRDNDGAWERILYASDALLLHPGKFHPVQHHPPGDAWRTEADRAAERHVFSMTPPAPNGGRTVAPLNGAWQYATWDERGPVADRTGPDELPPLAELPWRSLAVPGDRNVLLPDLAFNHRFVLRTRVDIPAAHAGRGFVFVFPTVNFIGTLFVNGERVGHLDIPHGHWEVDATRAVRPGTVNEIVVVMKDTFYAMAGEGQESLRYRGYMPASLFERNQGVTFSFDYPVKGHSQAGLLAGAFLHSVATVRVADAFVRTSVARREIAVDYTVANTTDLPRRVLVTGLVQTTDGATVLPLQPAVLDLAPGATATATVTSAWPESGALWWPDDPQLHVLATTLTTAESRPSVLDVHTVRFGFREWTLDGPDFLLNGIRWPLRADLLHYGVDGVGDTEAIAREWRERGVNMFRLRFQVPWSGLWYGDFLARMDELGVPVRYAATSFDGQHASYRMVVEAGGTRGPRADLFRNWRRQLENRILAHRNHPSVFAWELDNEIVYINSRNFGTLDVVEPEFTEAWRLIQRLDPTRTAISGGGSALRDRSLPTYGVHYFETDDRDYPDEAYTLTHSVGRQGTSNWQPWPMQYGDRPVFMSETAFLPGRAPADFAAFGGESVFLGRSETPAAAARYARWLLDGYRWKGVGGVHVWFSSDQTRGTHYQSWQPVALHMREWNGTFASRAEITRTLRLYNETRVAGPIEARWELRAGGRTLQQGARTCDIPPGRWEEFPITLTLPRHRGDAALEAEIVLTAVRGGREVFRDTRPVRVINPDAADLPGARRGEIVVWDPSGEAAARLGARDVRFTRIDSLDTLPGDFRLLVVGRGAVTPQLATDPRWMDLAARGRKILLLEQTSPLHYQAVPADYEVAPFTGRVAFLENPAHPVFAGLAEPDFICWSGDHVVYRTLLTKPTRGAKSLVHADEALGYTALALSEIEDGLLLSCQLVVGEKLATDPVAQRLFDNLVAFAYGHAVLRNATASSVPAASPTGRMISDLGLRYTPTTDPLAAIRGGDARIVLVDGSGPQLAQLAGAAAEVRRFLERGGWIQVFGVTQDTLRHFNALVGQDHVLRPFRLEKVTLPAVRDPLTAGLSQRDVVMYAGRRIAEHFADTFYADDAFTSVVDLEDIAPFAAWPSPAHFGDPGTTGPGDDTWPLNMVNNIEAAENWRYIFSIHLDKGDPASWEIVLPREEEVIGFSIAPNTIYHELRALRLVPDGDTARAQTFEIPAGAAGRQDLAVAPLRATRLGIELTRWDARGRANVIGVDNIWIRVRRPADFAQRVRPLLNVGGLVRYPFGEGGVVLNQLRFDEQESSPANGQKKRTIVATLLRNMGAVFAGGRTLVAGEGLRSEPVPLDAHCNLYLSRQSGAAGFPDRENDLGAIPVGRQRLAGINYLLRDFRTSPLESAVALRGRRPFNSDRLPRQVEGIAVGRTAEALFFLHALHPTDTWRPRNASEQPPVVFVYRVRYADGTQAEVPVRLGIGAGPWLVDQPRGLREAALAWAAPAPDNSGRSTVAYQMQWNNPKPEVAITAIDLVYGEAGDRWGTPILLGISTADPVR